MVTATIAVSLGESHLKELLSGEIKYALVQVISDPSPLKEALESRLPALFSLRMRAYYQLLEEQPDWARLLRELAEELPRLKQEITNKGHAVLAENFAFSLGLAIETALSLRAGLSGSAGKVTPVFPKIGLMDFMNLIRLEAIPEPTRCNLVQITETAILLDFALFLTYFYATEQIEIPGTKLGDLSTCLRDWAQLYGALAQALGVWRPRLPYERVDTALSREDIAEEKALAEMGLGDYLEDIVKSEGDAGS